jgi:hypothetical protein
LKCKICGSLSHNFGRSRVLNKYNVDYYQCSQCGFVFTEEPYWLEEAYDSAINESDIGLISRNLSLSKLTKAMILFLFNQQSKFLDYGGGYGVFVRLMRDMGFDFYRYDQYCENLFAKSFDVDIQNNSERFEILTAYELFEHLVNPLDEIDKMLKLSNSIIFSTELLPLDNPRPNEWWYYGLDHGQHTSIYTFSSLKYIADKFDINVYTNGRSIHLLTRNKINPLLFKLLSRGKVSGLINVLCKREGLRQQDYQDVIARIKNKE